MITYFILLGILVFSIIIIGVIVIRKFSVLSAIDLAAMKHHKQAQVKVSIVEERLERNIRNLKNKISIKSAPLRKKIKAKLQVWYHRALHLQKEYKLKALYGKPQKLEDKEAIRQKVNNLLLEADTFIKQDKLLEAEKKYIEAVSLDKQNIQTYRDLSALYIQKKDYDHAKETLEFIKQINPNNDAIWMQLAALYEIMNNYQEAVKYYKKAVDLAPKSPKNLDALLNISIVVKDSYLAKSTLAQLTEVNPENQKLAEYQQKIAEIK